MMQGDPDGSYDTWLDAVATRRSHLPKRVADFEAHLHGSCQEELLDVPQDTDTSTDTDADAVTD